jgi:hypothetical protein
MNELLAERSPVTRRGAAGPVQVPTPRRGPLTSSLWKLGNALVDRGVRAALTGVDRLSEKFEDVTRRGGLLPAAAGGGLAAFVAGRNPVWGAVRGMITGTSTLTKVLVVLAIVLALVLGPVVLVLLLLTLIVVAVVVAVRSGAGA